MSTLAKYEDLFLEIMLKHELGLDTPYDGADLDALKQGGVMFGAFFFFGAWYLDIFRASLLDARRGVFRVVHFRAEFPRGSGTARPRSARPRTRTSRAGGT